MTTFIMTTTINETALNEPQAYERIAKLVSERIKRECRQIEWRANYAVLGPFNYLDIFDAPDFDEAMKVVTIIRSIAPASVHVWPAKSWDHFKDLMRSVEIN